MQWQSCQLVNILAPVCHQSHLNKGCAHELSNKSQAILQECQQSCAPRVHPLWDDLVVPLYMVPHRLWDLCPYYSISWTKTNIHCQSADSIAQLVVVIVGRYYLCQPQWQWKCGVLPEQRRGTYTAAWYRMHMSEQIVTAKEPQTLNHQCRHLVLCPMNFQYIWSMTIVHYRPKHRDSNATSFTMGIELSIKCIVTIRTVLEVFKLLTCETFEEILFIGHITILQVMVQMSHNNNIANWQHVLINV